MQFLGPPTHARRNTHPRNVRVRKFNLRPSIFFYYFIIRTACALLQFQLNLSPSHTHAAIIYYTYIQSTYYYYFFFNHTFIILAYVYARI